MARTERKPIQTFGRVSIHRHPGNGRRYHIDTTYIIKVDGKLLTTISEFSEIQDARYFALGYAQGLKRGELS